MKGGVINQLSEKPGGKNRHLPKAHKANVPSYWTYGTWPSRDLRNSDFDCRFTDFSQKKTPKEWISQHWFNIFSSKMLTSNDLQVVSLPGNRLDLNEFQGLGANPVTANGKQALLLEGRHSHKNRCVMMCQLALLMCVFFAEENIGP